MPAVYRIPDSLGKVYVGHTKRAIETDLKNIKRAAESDTQKKPSSLRRSSTLP